MEIEGLIDADGENLAVRSFLLGYTDERCRSRSRMKMHMLLCGYPYWPEWVEDEPDSHLTKLGAQNWLRYLFALAEEDTTSLLASERERCRRVAEAELAAAEECGNHDAIDAASRILNGILGTDGTELVQNTGVQATP